MLRLGDLVFKVRSKNAGPFWITVDIFCGSEAVFGQMRTALTTTCVSDLFQIPKDQIKRFEIPSLNVIKFSLPRPLTQGHRFDRDMHGAQWAVLMADVKVEGALEAGV